MWIISSDAFCYLLSFAPLELKLWLLQAFFGVRYGTIICWFVYQASLERGSLRTITYNSAYDKSIWTSAMEYIINAPLGIISSSYAGGYLGRTLTGVFNQIVRSGSLTACQYGLIAAKKPQLALSSSWELVDD